MRYLFSFLLALPVLASCTVIQEDYYGPGYYVPAPEAQVHHHRHYDRYQQTNYHGHQGNRVVPRGKVYHRHADTGGSAVVVNPRRPYGQSNVHGHEPKVHGHSGVTHQAQNNTHGHGSNRPNSSVGSNATGQKGTHRHS